MELIMMYTFISKERYKCTPPVLCLTNARMKTHMHGILNTPNGVTVKLLEEKEKEKGIKRRRGCC